MSPERLDGKGCVMAGDIWSFGLVILELALGRYPYNTNFENMIEFILHI